MNPILFPVIVLGVFLAIGVCFGLLVAGKWVSAGFALAGRLAGWGKYRAPSRPAPAFDPRRLLAFFLLPPYTILSILGLVAAIIRSAIAVAVDVVEIVIDLLGILWSPLGMLLGDQNARPRLGQFSRELLLDLRRAVGNVFHPLGALLTSLGFGGTVAAVSRGWSRPDTMRLIPPPLHAEEGIPPPPLAAPFAGRYIAVEQLPSAGSGADLFIVRALGEDGMPHGERLLMKSFDLARGAWLENLVRESEGMRLAKRIGLVVDYMMGEDYFYYVLPFHEGETMTDSVAATFRELPAEAPLREPELRMVIGWVREVCVEVERFHSAGLIHKDIKPDNVILTEGGARVIDLGLVTQLSSAVTLTTHGTEYFRDPELVRMAMAGVQVKDVAAERFDIYALGALLYFAVEGTFPATGPFSTYRRPAPYALRVIASKAMSDFEKRYESVAWLLDDLDALLASRRLAKVKPARLPSFVSARG